MVNIMWITKTVFEPSHVVKCQLVFNFIRRLFQAHYDYCGFNFMNLSNVIENCNATLGRLCTVGRLFNCSMPQPVDSNWISMGSRGCFCVKGSSAV